MNAYNFDNNALALVHSNLSDRKQRTNIKSSFSPWHDIIIGVPIGSILGPLLFNIYINDIFYTIKNVEIANFADENSPFILNKFISEVLKLLEEESNKLYRWHELNWLKPNADKYHLLLNSHDMNLGLKINTDKVRSSSEEKLLGVTFDNDFLCITHVKRMRRKASKKLHALYRICNYMILSQRRILMKAFIESQFGYCPLACIFHGTVLPRISVPRLSGPRLSGRFLGDFRKEMSFFFLAQRANLVFNMYPLGFWERYPSPSVKIPRQFLGQC